MKKLSIYLLVLIIVLGAGAYFYFNKSSAEAIKYRTDKITRGDIVVQVRATGTINPVQTVAVGSQVSGTIARINVDFNSVVKKGEILAQIDSTFLYASVKEAEANVERSRVQVNQSKRIFDRTKELMDKNLAAQADLDLTQATYESAVADLKQSQAALDRVKVNLRYSTIKSPIDGVVISRDVDVGQTVAASLQAPQLFSIANDLTRMQVEASVDEADIGQIKEGQAVTFTVDSYPDESFRGIVKQVRLSPVVSQNVVTYTVIIDVPNPDLKLRPGMTATVSVLIDKRESVLRIPTLALRFQPGADVLEKSGISSPGSRSQQNGSQQMANTGEQRQRRPGNSDNQSDSQSQGRKQGAGNGQENGDVMKSQPHEGKKRARSINIWIPDGKNGLKPLKIKIGLNDPRYVEIIEGDLREGSEIIIGTQVNDAVNSANGQTNPFAPRMPGGGGRPGR